MHLAVLLFQIAVIAVAAIIDFDAAFTLFHVIGFSNDLWQLDPYRDYLLLLFPEAFFFDATMAIAIMAALEFGVALTGIGWFERRFGRSLPGSEAPSTAQQGEVAGTGDTPEP